MTEAELKAELKTGLRGVYVLAGEEEFLKQHYLSLMRKAVITEEAFESFNHTVVSYPEEGFGNLPDSLPSAPFMAEQRLCELWGFPFENAKEGPFNDLLALVKDTAGNEECVFILYVPADQLDTSRSSRTMKKLTGSFGKYAKIVVFEKTGEQKLGVWAKRHFTAEELAIGDAEIIYLLTTCGKDMLTLKGEIEKLCSYKKATGSSTVSRQDIDYICCKNEELGAFALANAVLAGNTDEALHAMAEYRRANGKATGKEFLAPVSAVYCDLCTIKAMMENGMSEADIASALHQNEYKVKLYCRSVRSVPARILEHAASLCTETDNEMKQGGSDFLLMERLICRIAVECRR